MFDVSNIIVSEYYVFEHYLFFHATENIWLMLHEVINIAANIIRLKIGLFLFYGRMNWKH
jgi:hypothetical protein